MTELDSSVRNISDTARWVAYFRARETERPDALFSDPYAERLAGERGFQIANTLPEGNKHEWAWVARTYLFDKFLAAEILKGADLVVNLAAGLDARPYRMEVPANLQWICRKSFPTRTRCWRMRSPDATWNALLWIWQTFRRGANSLPALSVGE